MSKILRILLVEDNVADADLLISLFGKGHQHRFHFEVAQDGEIALANLAEVGRPKPDLIVMDLNLPRKDGREVLRELRGRAEMKRIPVLVLTSSDRPDDVRRCYELGANCVMNKPLELDEITLQVQAIENFWLDLVRLPGPMEEKSAA